MPKITLFLLKNRKNRLALGTEDPHDSGNWGLRPYTPELAPESHYEFLAARLLITDTFT